MAKVRGLGDVVKVSNPLILSSSKGRSHWGRGAVLTRQKSLTKDWALPGGRASPAGFEEAHSSVLRTWARVART